MSSTNINFEKVEPAHPSTPISDHSDRLQAMEGDLQKFLKRLEKPYEHFNPSDVFDELLRYFNNYDRILYSTISNTIYAHYDCNDGVADPAGTLLTNLDALIRYSENESNIVAKKVRSPKIKRPKVLTILG